MSFHHNLNPNLFSFLTKYTQKVGDSEAESKDEQEGTLESGQDVGEAALAFITFSEAALYFSVCSLSFSDSVVLFVAGCFPEGQKRKEYPSALITSGRILAVKSETRPSGGEQERWVVGGAIYSLFQESVKFTMLQHHTLHPKNSEISYQVYSIIML